MLNILNIKVYFVNNKHNILDKKLLPIRLTKSFLRMDI